MTVLRKASIAWPWVLFLGLMLLAGSTVLPAEVSDVSTEFLADNWTTENGLPGNSVTSLCQTRDGYLWIGTQDGLARFDGLQFTVFGNPEGLTHTRVLCLYEDCQGSLWVGTEGGGVFRHHSGKFQRCAANVQVAQDNLVNRIQALAETTDGRLYAGTHRGLQVVSEMKLRPAKGQGLSEDLIQDLKRDGQGQIWLIQQGWAIVITNDSTSGQEDSLGLPKDFVALGLGLSRNGSAYLYGQPGLWQWMRPERRFGSVAAPLGSLRITCSGAGKGEDLWLGTDGQGVFHWIGGRLELALRSEVLHNRKVKALVEDREGNLWVGLDAGGLYRLKKRGFKTYATGDGLSHEVVTSLSEDRQGVIWVGTSGGGLNRFHQGHFEVVEATNLTRDPRIGSDQVPNLTREASILSLSAATQGGVWIGLPSGVLLLRDGPTRYLEWGTVPLTLHPDPSGGVWAGTHDGMLVFLKEGTSFPGLIDDVQFYGGALTDAQVQQLFEHPGLVATEPPGDKLLGRWMLDEQPLTASTVLQAAAGPNGRLISESVTNLNRSAPGVQGTAVRLDGSWEYIEVPHDDRLNVGRGDFTVAAWIYPETYAQSGIVSKGAYWWGRGWLLDFSPQVPGALRLQTSLGQENGQGGIQTGPYALQLRQWQHVAASVVRDPSARAGQNTTGKGLSKLFINGRRVETGDIGDGDLNNPALPLRIGCMLPSVSLNAYTVGQELSGNFITSIVEDGSGGLWIGTSGGGVYRKEQKQFRNYSTRDGLVNDFVRSLYFDPEGVLWIGTSGGLSRLKEGRFASFTARDGLTDDVVSQILEDNAGHLWLGTPRGLGRWRKPDLEQFATGKSRTSAAIPYGKNDGMPNLQCTAGLRSRDGRLWFGTMGGLVVVDPKTLPFNTLVPPVVVEQMLVDAKPQLRTNQEKGVVTRSAWPEHPTRLRVGPGRQNLEFRYTALSLTAPEKQRFKYRLEGLDLDWIEAGHRRVANYNHVPPGEFCFRVQACNNDGVWNEAGTSLAFVVTPFFWQTGLFRVGVGMLLIGAVAALIHQSEQRKTRRRLERFEHERALEAERSRIARDIHDDLGARLTKVRMLAQLLERAPPGQSAHYVQDITSTTDEMLVAMDETVWAVNPRNDTLAHLAHYIFHYTEEFFRHTATRRRMKMPDEWPEISMPVPVRHHLFLVVKEALNNVHKHAAAAELHVELSLAEGVFLVVIRDNGCGFLPSESRLRGNGLPNMKQRLEELGGRLTVQSEPGQGTTVTMEIQVSQSTGHK